MDGLRTFLASVDQSPLPRTGDNAVPRLTEGWASLGIAIAMYDQGPWESLVDAMGVAVSGDGTSLMQLADAYADRNPGGSTRQHHGGHLRRQLPGPAATGTSSS